MPSVQRDSPLTAGQLAELRERLDARERSLREQVSLRRAALEPPAAASRADADAADLAAVRAQVDVESQLIDRNVREVETIGRAVARLDAGVYGRCAACGEDIGWERLKARPTSLRCAPCEQAHERSAARPLLRP